MRIRVSGGWYHVFTRGHNRERIFACDEDCAHFLELVAAMRAQYRLRVHAYCLMPNHYHLLVRTPEANVSRAIQWLNGSYGIWYNKRHDRGGHLFGERFKGILVENGARGLEVSLYREMVEGRIRQGVEEDLWSQVRWGAVLGAERFARKVRGRIVIGPETRGRRDLRKRRDFEEIVRMVERMKGVSWMEFRDRYGDWGRDLALWAGRRFCGMRLADLGAKAGGIGNSAVTVAVQRLQQKARRQRNIRRAMKAITTECEL